MHCSVSSLGSKPMLLGEIKGSGNWVMGDEIQNRFWELGGAGSVYMGFLVKAWLILISNNSSCPRVQQQQWITNPVMSSHVFSCSKQPTCFFCVLSWAEPFCVSRFRALV